MNRILDPIQDMSPPQHLLAQLHQIRHAMFPISDEFLKLEGDQGDRLGTVEFESSRETFLGEEAQVGEQELVLLMNAIGSVRCQLRPARVVNLPVLVVVASC